MDEPTNDLDITTLTILEDFLDSFEGIVIVVSHDRYFLDRVVRRIFAFEENGHLRQYEGGYTDYAIKREMEQFLSEEAETQTGKQALTDNQAKASKKEWKKSNEHRLKLSYKEQREYDTIEADIAALEEKIEELETEIIKNARDFVKLNELTKQKEEAEKALEEKMDRWMYLEELVAKIAQTNAK